MKHLKLFLFLLPIWLLTSELPGQTPQVRTDPEDVFEQVWQVLNSNYPYFRQRGINWQTMYKVYRPRITSGTTDDELYRTLCSMLEHFNDGHVNLEAGKDRFCSAKTANAIMEDFSWKLIRDKYLNRSFKASPDSLFYYGWLTDEFAYLRIRRFPAREVLEKYIDTIMSEIIPAKGIVLDVRGNSGGNGFGVAALASRFADRKRLYMKNINRVGQGKEYTNTTYHYLEPLGPAQYRGPVILLQNVFSASGSEAFALAMRVLPHATSIGETTEGCFANYYPQKLINSWTVTMPWSYAVDQNDFCWEGMGVPPDLRKTNTKEDIAAGNDMVLELAIEILKAGGNSRKEADGSLNQMKISLVEQFVATSAAQGFGSAAAQLNKSRKQNPEGVYFSIQELAVSVRGLLQAERNEVALALLELGRQEFPDDINTLYFLARLYENFKKQPEKAKPIWEKLATLIPSFPWEVNPVAEAKKTLGTGISNQ